MRNGWLLTGDVGYLCRSLESATKLAERFIASLFRHSTATADLTHQPAAASRCGCLALGWLLFVFVFLAPLLETLLQCVVPYWLMLKVQGTIVGRHPWGFVAVSALILALLHLAAWPSAILLSLVTGSFLA